MPHLYCSRFPQFLFAALGAGLLLTLSAFGSQTNSYIDLAATVSSVPAPQVTLAWNAQKAGVTISIYRRVMGVTGGSGTWVLRGTAVYPTASFTDAITEGTIYEYKVYRPYVDATTQDLSAFTAVTLNAPVVHNRGKLLLVVDTTQAAALAGELTQLEMDLAGDGWTVQRIDSARHGSGAPAALRTAIQAAYAADPTNVKAVYLFGHLPIPMSGWDAPDGHASKPQDADGFYGDMTGAWTDTSNFGTGNVPGDGIYDQNYFPSKLKLMVGRVDFASMGSFHKSEVEYLRDYIHKSHAFRQGRRTEVPRRGLWSSYYLWQERNWIIPMFGAANITFATFQPTLATEPHLFGVDFGIAWGGDGNYTQTPNKLVFGINFGSYKLYYDLADNAMRSLLAQPDWGLTCVWGARPAWFFHHMSAGLPVGYSALQTMNNWSGSPDYFPTGDYSFQAGNVQESLMGDPTLRLHPVEPPENVAVAKAGASAVVTWQASPDPAVSGYYVYSSTSRLGPYTLLTAAPVAATTFTDTAPPAGDVFYQVRALKTELTAPSIYANLSQAGFAKLKADGSSNRAPTAQGGSLSAPGNQQPNVALAGTDPDNDTLTPIVLTNPSLGELRWTGSVARYVPKAGTSGSDSIRYVLSDGVTTSAPVTISVDATPAGFVRFAGTTQKVSRTVGTAQIGVERAGGSTGAITVACTVANGSAVAGTHFTTPSGTLSWADGETGIKNISIPITNSAAPQQTRQFRITLGSPTGGASIGLFTNTAVLIEDPAATLPNPWSQALITNSGQTTLVDSSPAVSAEGALGSVTMGGSGLDSSTVWESGQFIYQSRTGDGVLVALVPPSTPVQSASRCAVMVRSGSVNGGEVMAATVTSSTTFGSKFIYRTAQYITSVITGTAPTESTPRWIRIIRVGNTFTSQSSADGSTWTTLGSADLPGMPATAQWGLFHLSVTPSLPSGSLPVGYGDFQLAMFQNVSLSDPPAPVPPANFALTSPANTSATLTWTPSALTVGYRIERRDESGQFALLTDISSGLTATYTDSTLVAGNAYQYRIFAYNTGGDSASSPLLNVAPSDANPIRRPGLLTAAAAAGSNISLAWTDNSADETGFQLERRAVNGDWALVQALPANTTGFTDATTLPGVIYEYRVRAVGAAGGSAWATPVASLQYGSVATINRSVWSSDNVVFNRSSVTPGNAHVPTSFIYDPPTTSLVTSQTLGTVQSGADGWYGSKLTLGNSEVMVRELSRWVVAGNTGTHTVKLVDATTGVDVPNGSVAVSTAGAPVGFKSVPLATPVILPANTAYYVVSQEFQGDSLYDGTTALATTGVATVNNSVSNNNGIHFNIDFESPSYAAGNAFTANGSSTLPTSGPLPYKITKMSAGTGNVWTAAVEAAGPTGNRLLFSNPTGGGVLGGSVEVHYAPSGGSTGTWFTQMDYTRLTTGGGPMVSMRLINAVGQNMSNHPNNPLLYADKWEGTTLDVGTTYTLRVEIDMGTTNWRTYLNGVLKNSFTNGTNSTGTNGFGGLQLGFFGTTYGAGAVFALDNIKVGKVAATPNEFYVASATGSRGYGPVAFGYTLAPLPFVSGHNMTTLRNDYTGWLGMEVTVGNSPLPIEQLGRWVAPGNTGPHTVKLVDAVAGTILGSASVNTAGATSGQFKFGNLAAPVTLAANSTYYVLSQETAGGDQWYDYSFAAAGNATGYQAWLLANGLPMDQSGAGSATASPASDGLPNLVKYALGLAPGVTGHGGRLSSGQVADAGNDYLSLTYTRPEPVRTGITYTVEASPDLVGWTTAGLVQVSSTVNGAMRTITVRDATALAGGAKRFMRLRVTQP